MGDQCSCTGFHAQKRVYAWGLGLYGHQEVWSLDLLMFLSPITFVGWVLCLLLPETSQLQLLSSTSDGGVGVGGTRVGVKHMHLTLWGEAQNIYEGLHLS